MPTSLQYATDFLSKWDLRPEDLLNHIRPVQPSETVLLVGSIADGLANALSDIDLLIIGDGELDGGFISREAACEESVARLAGGQEVNLEYWQTSTLEQLHERLSANFELMKNPIPQGWFTRLTDSELRLLHRLRSGVVLANPEIATHWREQMQLESLPVYLVLNGVGMHFTYREDAIAQIQYEGDVLSALVMIRLAAEHMGFAMMASTGETLPARKWLTRMLRRSQDVLGERRVSELMRYLFPNPQDDAAALVSSAVDFFDTVIGESIERCPEVLPVMLELSGAVSFVTTLESGRPATSPLSP